ncbi:MAG TPA: DUF5663 domain-containing protein [Candidatus Doudnabacteria bacterium]|nr:DUF5663 domain-containing protein [Candidatus Doudnabacteria bacterium]
MLKESIDKLITELGLESLGEEEKYQVAAQITDHLNQVMIDTLTSNLNAEQLARFEALTALDDAEKMDEGIAQLTAEIPNIHFKIEEAIEHEMNSLRAAKQVMDK